MAVVLDAVLELALLAVPLGVATLVGLLVGWAWRPEWASGLVSRGEAPESVLGLLPGRIASFMTVQRSGKEAASFPTSPRAQENEALAVTSEDFEHLRRLVGEADGGPEWRQLMDRSLPNMRYKAWWRDREIGPPQYRSSTIFEDMTPEIVRDFFWDDEFRIENGWDDMLLYHETLDECPTTGIMIVHWIRKFPFFCSDREYTIGRRIWESGRSYYCVTKGLPCPSVPRRNKPRRVDTYYSSWCIRAVESRRGGAQMTSCEVLLFHHEDMGIPWEIAKLGVRQGMWGCVKKIEPGLRAYQIARRSSQTMSRCAVMAQINTKINVDDGLVSLGTSNDTPDVGAAEKQKPWGLRKFLVVGGAVALACTLDRGLLTKAVIFGIARRSAKLGRRFLL